MIIKTSNKIENNNNMSEVNIKNSFLARVSGDTDNN